VCALKKNVNNLRDFSSPLFKFSKLKQTYTTHFIGMGIERERRGRNTTYRLLRWSWISWKKMLLFCCDCVYSHVCRTTMLSAWLWQNFDDFSRSRKSNCQSRRIIHIILNNHALRLSELQSERSSWLDFHSNKNFQSHRPFQSFNHVFAIFMMRPKSPQSEMLTSMFSGVK
jgi:hypothetical protein